MSEEPTKTPEWHYWMLARLPRPLAVLFVLFVPYVLPYIWHIKVSAFLLLPPMPILIVLMNIAGIYDPLQWLLMYAVLVFVWAIISAYAYIAYDIARDAVKAYRNVNNKLPRREKKQAGEIEDDAPARLSLPETEDEPTLADIYDDVNETKRK